VPRIFDNIDQHLLTALCETIDLSYRGDFCVGYLNLRGWSTLAPCIEQWAGGEGHACRVLVGMQDSPEEEVRAEARIVSGEGELDNQTANRLRKQLAEDFRKQLTYGAPTNQQEAALRQLVAQLRAKKVYVRLFLAHKLHAKLYLLFRNDPINPIVGYLGSSNLTLAGLSKQGELNVDVLDGDACRKLSAWFEDRWDDRWCIDISDELADIIEESWAREDLIPPYYIYLKMAYHLSQEARSGLSEFQIPHDIGRQLFDFQKAAVKIAAHHLNKRGGVLIGDVVGLGKTMMATAVARIFEDDFGLETLIICPKNLVNMWEFYRSQYGLRARVLSVSQVLQKLPELPRYRLVIVDESHNLRNREGKRFKVIQDYIQKNESKCILLTATPYNKTYVDLSSQLQLFIPPDKDLGIRPERLLAELGETEFIRRHQSSVKSLAAFDHSQYPDDWRELMRLFMVRRTRSFIQTNYAETDPDNGRKFLTFADGSRSYFPQRVPKTAKFEVGDDPNTDQYARLFSATVVDTISALGLPRYGLGNYVTPRAAQIATPAERKLLDNLSRAGERLMGFCRTNFFKRLESSGEVFIESLERHALRNYVFLHALEHKLPLPLGTQDTALLNTRLNDEDEELGDIADQLDLDTEGEDIGDILNGRLRTAADFKRRAEVIYNEYATRFKTRFKWVRPELFVKPLAQDLRNDSLALLLLLEYCGRWDPEQDEKLKALEALLRRDYPLTKVLVFTQFADTVRYLEQQLKKRGLTQIEGVSGDSPDPTALAWRFSPISNGKGNAVAPSTELRVLIATDVLSEGQNLQDAHVVVNYDLPWAIIRLIQRAGRVDRIGQSADQILCYSFLPADGVEHLIRLRARVRQRLHENADVVGTDEAFFEDDDNDQKVVDLYNEKAGILDDDEDAEVDLASYAYQIWKNAITADPSLQKTIPALPPIVFATRPHVPTDKFPEGVMVYVRTGEGNDALAYVDEQGRSITESQFAILRAAECTADTPALPRHADHHELVRRAAEQIVKEERSVGGQLGRPSGARFRTYERLKYYLDRVKGTFFESPELKRAIDEIYRYPLRQSAVDTLNRQLRAGISDEDLAERVVVLREEDRLCLIDEERQAQEPTIICSMGVFDRQYNTEEAA
jgi:superfamily II DNA or RNA helicase